ncbi:MAG: hypothetical protein BHV77_15880 [Bacteroides sp. 43_108]|nr:MAG: hypothetical protein BHV77_15880 [Bacteroides sp. 43_108]
MRIQIYCAIIAYWLIAIVQYDMKFERSIYEVLQILVIFLTDKTFLCDLLDKSNFKMPRIDMFQVNRIYLIFNLVHF